MTTLSMTDRVTRYETIRVEGRLIRRAWTKTDDAGRELACWLAALSPEVGAVKHAGACPADVMPAWLALLTPDLDDRVSDGAWPAFAERFGACAARWSVLDDAAWRRVEVAVLRECLAVASESTDDARVLATIAEVDRLLRDGGTPEARAAAREEAWAAAWAAAWSAARAAACEAAWDRIATALFGAIDAECDEKENEK
jgi:hypothetical protein